MLTTRTTLSAFSPNTCWRLLHMVCLLNSHFWLLLFKGNYSTVHSRKSLIRKTIFVNPLTFQLISNYTPGGPPQKSYSKKFCQIHEKILPWSPQPTPATLLNKKTTWQELSCGSCKIYLNRYSIEHLQKSIKLGIIYLVRTQIFPKN